MRVVVVLILVGFYSNIHSQIKLQGEWRNLTDKEENVFIFDQLGNLSVGRYMNDENNTKQFEKTKDYKLIFNYSKGRNQIELVECKFGNHLYSYYGILKQNGDSTITILFNRVGGKRPKSFRRYIYNHECWILKRND
jgi:hypothetical protein